MTARRIGILGGTFDPIHCGHIDLGHAAQAALGLTRLFVVTANIPPHRPQPVASAYHRFAMTAMAVAGRDGWQASDLELCAGAHSFTRDTLARFHEQGYGSSELFFVIGTDAFLEIESWRDYPAILDQAHFAVVSRPAWPLETVSNRLPHLANRMQRRPFVTSGEAPLIFLIDAPTADAASTAIRRRLAEGRSVAGLVPPSVQQHIEQHELYTRTMVEHHDSHLPDKSTAGRLHGQD
jgi:nicotinate-nucleotide adenylyltransferase